MLKPAFPNNEDDRLRKLRSLHILDSDSDERFDRITRMAKRLFDVPTAVVSLIDAERQWSLSAAGADRSEAPREISFCGHTILEDRLLIVENTLEDPRFADNPLVCDVPNLRFYAGYPVRVNGLTMGTLCVIDQKPRSFTDDDILALEDLGALVEKELETSQLATIDELTQISNRRGFSTLSESALDFCRHHQRTATLMYIDLDNFKPINDSHGHAVGDKVLRNFADILKTTLREYDLFARIGGDEFAALLTAATASDAKGLISRLQQAVAEYNAQSNLSTDLSFSYGFVEIDHRQPPSVETLLAEADQQMYQMKQSKRPNGAVIF